MRTTPIILFSNWSKNFTASKRSNRHFYYTIIANLVKFCARTPLAPNKSAVVISRNGPCIHLYG